MLASCAFLEWTKTFDQTDWMLILTVWLTVLTLIICVLTVAVVCYAKRTLHATQESLDFFFNPNVTIEGQRDVSGPYGGDHFGGGCILSLRVTLTVSNNSPLEILIPGSSITFRLLPEESSDPTRAKRFSVARLTTIGRMPPDEYYVVEKILPFVLELRGAALAEGETPLKLTAEFKVASYLYRGKSHGPLIARCTFLIERQ